MPEKVCRVVVEQVYSPVLEDDHLQHLINSERGAAVFYPGVEPDNIVPLNEFESLGGDIQGLLSTGWRWGTYEAYVDSYSIADLRSFVWGWHSDDSDPLESSSPVAVEAAVRQVESRGASEVGFLSSLVVFHDDNEMSTQLIAATNYGDDQLRYMLVAADEATDVADWLTGRPDPRAESALRSRVETRKLIFRDAAELVPEIVTAVQGLHSALDTRFIDFLKDHKIDQ